MSLFDAGAYGAEEREYQSRLPDPGRTEIGAFHAPESGAPETEREAAIMAYPSSGTKRKAVLDFLVERGDQGATDEEVSIALDMRLYTAAPRRNELLRDGWIVDSGRRRRTTTGSPAAVWILSAAGRRELDERA